MTTWRRSRVFCVSAIAVLCLGLFGSRRHVAQGLGGAGTVQGTVKDPTGGVMQAVEVRISNPVSGLHANGDDRRGGPVRLQQPAAESVSHRGRGAGVSDARARRRRAERRPDHAGPDARAGRRDDRVEVVGHAEDLLERDPTAHTDIDQSLIAKLPIETSSGGLNQVVMLASPGVVADSNGFFHPDRRPRADAVLDRQPADHRPAEPPLLESDLAGCRAVDGSHHRRGAGRVRRQEQPGRAHRDQVGSRPGEADRQRVVRLRVVQEPDAARSTSAAARTRSATSCRCRACGPIASSIRRSSKRCTTRGTTSSLFDRFDFRPGDADTLHLNIQAAQSGFDVPNTYDTIDADAAPGHHDASTSRRAIRA